jgi:hypothetical protein
MMRWIRYSGEETEMELLAGIIGFIVGGLLAVFVFGGICAMALAVGKRLR